MTDLNDRFAAMLEGEPDAPDDIERVITGGRRAVRRRNTLAAVAGTAGTAAMTAAVVVPITAAHHHSATRKISVLATPPAPKCTKYYSLAPKRAGGERRAESLLKRKMAGSAPATATITTDQVGHGRTHAYIVTVCPEGATPAPDATKPTPTTPPQPSYHYDADPQTIADGFTRELSTKVKEWGLAIVYTRAFAQETSTLDKGHPSYYDGNVDVQLPDGPADVGVQVTHETTELVPFDNSCAAPDCSQSKLPGGSIMQVSHVKSGGGGEVVVVEIHHPDGLVVEAQESNYAFGPEATRARTKEQPLTVDQLTQLVEDPAFSF
ncbi:MAG: hypothetical protein ACTHK4_04310 [Mycobacteriales bacterium]